MPMDDPLAYLLPHAPALAAVLVITALPLAAAVLLAPPRRRTVPAVQAGIGLLLGSIALVSAPGLQGPFPYDPAVLTADRIAHTAAGSLLIAGTLCLLAAVVLTLLRPRGGRGRMVLGSVAALLIGLGLPFAFRVSLGRQLGTMELHGGVLVPVVVGLPLLAVLSGLLALAGSRAAAAAVGITAAAVPAAVLIATASGMHLLSLHTGAQLAPLPPGPILAASVCVGLLGVGVWKMAGNYWAGPERVNPAGDRPASSSRSS